MNKLKRRILVSVLSISLVLSWGGIVLATGSMDDMDMGAPAAAAPSAQHEATPEMDTDMPGMDKNEPTGTSSANDGHGENEASEGVNWSVVGGFLVINLLVIGSAGVLKFTQKPKFEITE